MTDYSPRATTDCDQVAAVCPVSTSDDGGGRHSLVGRRHRLQTAGEWLISGGSVLFFGPIGVGKSAAVDVITAPAVQSRVLRYAPGSHEATQPFSTLAGLLSSITGAELDEVPSARRRVLEAALSGDFTSLTPAAARLAALNLFRVLARTAQLLVIVDDLQWVDDQSVEVFRFVAPRVGDLPVQMAAAERVAPGCLPSRRGMCPPPLLVVRLEAVDAAPL